MPVDQTAVGRDGIVVARIEDDLTADRYGNAGLIALATPALVGLFEQAAMRALGGPHSTTRSWTPSLPPRSAQPKIPTAALCCSPEPHRSSAREATSPRSRV